MGVLLTLLHIPIMVREILIEEETQLSQMELGDFLKHGVVEEDLQITEDLHLLVLQVVVVVATLVVVVYQV
tara:strand:- start:188 stop:400 length:213 start_codon:yes stop_codon:yes gene_type:complete